MYSKVTKSIKWIISDECEDGTHGKGHNCIINNLQKYVIRSMASKTSYTPFKLKVVKAKQR